jgi:large subunit ribosomal protein L10Ae
MSKINPKVLANAINDILAYSKGEKIEKGGATVQGKQRKFLETIELQLALKNYDVSKDKRFSGTFKLPEYPRPALKVCMLANEAHAEQCKEMGLDFLTVADLKKFNKDKKLIMSKLANVYDAFLASDSLIKQLPRLLGPSLSRAGKFPTRVMSGENPAVKLDEVKGTIKFQLKKVLCMSLPIGNVSMDATTVSVNVQLAINFLITLLKKGWQNIKVIYLKSSMGPAFPVYF